MRFVAVEYDNNKNNSHINGYMRIPDNFSLNWDFGFRKYLENIYDASNIKIYPLNMAINSDNMGCDNKYKNMEDIFILALRSNVYYPVCTTNDYIRRQWALLDPSTQSFTVKER